jgi:hypothetical protein
VIDAGPPRDDERISDDAPGARISGETEEILASSALIITVARNETSMPNRAALDCTRSSIRGRSDG